MTASRVPPTIVTVMVAMFLLTLVGTTGPTIAQESSTDCVQLYINGTLEYESSACTEVTPTPTPEDTVTPTPTPEPTSTPTPEPTATPESRSHDTSVWHEPSDHHHGHSPSGSEIHPAIADFFANHPFGPEFEKVGNSWLTSAAENEYPYPGKHVGFTNLVELDTGCQTSARDGSSSGDCVQAYYLQVHTLGLAEALRTRLHSDKIVALVCSEIGGQCDIVAMGGHADYGMMHSQYKDTICPDPDNPQLPSDYEFQPPYRTVNLSARDAFLWSSNINAVVEPYYDPDPNRRLQIVWSERPWESPATGDACLDPAQDVVTGHDGSEFQLFSILLNVNDLPRPFEGWTDVHGNVDPSCVETGPDCVPIYIGPDVPANSDFTLLRSVKIGDANAAPILDYSASSLEMPGQ